MPPSWLVIAGVTVLIALVIRPSSQDFRWFLRLRRPQWLTFERAIPLIWTTIFICGAWSAVLVWEARRSPWLMVAYALLEVLIMAYAPVMCKLRSLRVGTWIGAIGFGFGCGLAVPVAAISQTAFFLLLPYLLWSPVGTFVTWKMIKLNPTEA